MSKEKDALFTEYLNKWKAKTWAGWWSIEVEYYNNYDYLEKENQACSSTVATCHTSWEYMNARITVNSDALDTLDEDEIEECAVHELMHIFLNEMREDGIDHEERVATVLARSFLLAGKK